MSDVKVLIADDEKGIRDIIKEYLLSEEFVVVEAIDGVDALNKFQNNQIHLVALDVMMPNLNDPPKMVHRSTFHTTHGKQILQKDSR